MKRRITKILMFICLCCLLAGCSKKEEEKVEITMIHGWGSMEADHVAMRRIYEEFEKEHPHIHLNLIAMPSSTDVIGKVGDLLTVGEIPDIIFTGGDGRESVYSFMVKKGYAVDLIPYIEEDEEFAGNVSQVVLDKWTTNEGKLYTISDVLLMGGYWYNEDIFEQAGVEKVPETWEEWFEACEKIDKMENDVIPVILDSNHISYLMAALLANENVSTLDNIRDSRMNVNTPAFDRMLDQLRAISEYAILAGDYNYRDTLSGFNNEESAIYINGVWASSMIDEKLRVSYAPFPSDDGKGIATRSACVGYILGNTKDEKRMEASVEFLKYMLSEPVAYRILEETGQLPSNPKVEISEELANGRLYDAVEKTKEADHYIEVPANLWSRKIQTAYGQNLIMYMEDKISIEEMHKNLEGLF